MAGESHPFGKDWSLGHYLRRRPATVVDIGPGQGTYAQLFRPLHRGWWVGVEIHEPYVDRFGLRDLYDRVEVADGLTWCPDYPVDLVILGDVVEHLPAAQGAALVRAAQSYAAAVLVSIPLGEYRQGPIDGNDHETHHATWAHQDVLDLFGGDCDYLVGDVVGCYSWPRSPS